jgi:tRNA (guanine-N7-)-methyltransferase
MVEALREFSDIVTVFDQNFFGVGRWKERFPFNGSLQVELGTGKGQYLRQMAELYPTQCFIGMEREPGVLLQAVRKTQELGVANLKFILADVQYLPQIFAPAEVEDLYIHFCDPWPKSRHDKRRLTHAGFLSVYRTVLAPTGVLHFKTDNRPLFDYSLASFAEFGMSLSTVSFDLHAEKVDSARIMTEYEAKFAAAGLPIHYCEARFAPSSEEVAARA